MRFRTIALFVALFLITFLSGAVLASYIQNNPGYNLTFLNPERNWEIINGSRNITENMAKEDPIDNGTGKFTRLTERASPFDRVKEDQIEVYEDRIIINMKGAEWAKFTDTNSMDPIIDFGANAIEVKPDSEKDIYVGDIISFDDGKGNSIIHRVVETGTDDNGWYAITKGDNASENDAGKVRFSQVQRVVAIIIY